MASPALTPSTDLVTLNTSPSPGAPTGRFVLFTDSWLDVQNYVQQALQLPLSKNDFQKNYGDFPVAQKGHIDKVVKALGAVGDLSGTFGNPSTLKQKILSDTSYLQGVNPPNEIYAHIVWLANQIYNTSTTFQFTFDSLPAILGPTGGSAEERAAALKEILTGNGGLQSSARNMAKLTGDLLEKLLRFETEVNSANEDVQEYFGRRSAIVDVVNKLIGEYQAALDELKEASDDAYSKWKTYTIAAVAATIGLMVIGALLAPLTLGGSLALVAGAHVAGVGLALTATSYLSKYNKLCAQMKGKEAEKIKKTQLITDVNAFNASIGNVAPALTNFKTNLQKVQGVWTDISMNLGYIVNNYNTSQLSDMNWLMQALKIEDAKRKWGLIGKSAQEFTQDSLVSYDFSTKFGQPIPVAA